jgi:hypothetical protein
MLILNSSLLFLFCVNPDFSERPPAGIDFLELPPKPQTEEQEPEELVEPLLSVVADSGFTSEVTLSSFDPISETKAHIVPEEWTDPSLPVASDPWSTSGVALKIFDFLVAQNNNGASMTHVLDLLMAAMMEEGEPTSLGALKRAREYVASVLDCFPQTFRQFGSGSQISLHIGGSRSDLYEDQEPPSSMTASDSFDEDLEASEPEKPTLPFLDSSEDSDIDLETLSSLLPPPPPPVSAYCEPSDLLLEAQKVCAYMSEFEEPVLRTSIREEICKTLVGPENSRNEAAREIFDRIVIEFPDIFKSVRTREGPAYVLSPNFTDLFLEDTESEFRSEFPTEDEIEETPLPVVPKRPIIEGYRTLSSHLAPIPGPTTASPIPMKPATEPCSKPAPLLLEETPKQTPKSTPKPTPTDIPKEPPQRATKKEPPMISPQARGRPVAGSSEVRFSFSEDNEEEALVGFEQVLLKEKKSCSTDDMVSDFFFGNSEKSKSLAKQGFTLASRQLASESFAEAAFLGRLVPSREKKSGTPVAPVINPVDSEIYLNTHEPFCIATVGVQGSGKSHTLAVILESCLIPFAAPKNHEIIRLSSPMTALVLHYDQNVTSLCEATGLICPSPDVPAKKSGTTGNIFSLPREKMVVLVSPSYYLQRKKFYGDYCEVRPLLFQWGRLSADHIKKLMCIKEGDNQLYVASMLSLLRGYQRNSVLPEFRGFLDQIREVCSTVKSQEAPLAQRIALLESFVAESETNETIRNDGADLFTCLGSGVLVVADLTDPLLSSSEANGIFQVLTEQFRSIPVSDGCGKILALDEAHKFMKGDSTDGLSNAIVNAARLMRHDGLRVVVSTQSPKALAPELLELVTLAILHRFHSRDWFDHLRAKIPLQDEIYSELVSLVPGEALMFASRHLLETKEMVLRLGVRKRITADRGSSRTNKQVAEESG